MPLKQDGDRYGFQARTGRREKLAPSRRSQPVAKADHRRKVHRRHRSRQPTAASRLTPDRHQISAIARRIPSETTPEAAWAHARLQGAFPSEPESKQMFLLDYSSTRL